MEVSIVLNEPVQNISGGYKVIYTYANELAKKGDKVTIYYKCRKNILFSNYKLPFFLKLIIANLIVISNVGWFTFDKSINRKIIISIDNKYIKDADVVVATAADTAQDVYKLAASKGRKFYFIQGYETWVLSEEELIATYRLDMTKITVSNWLKKLVEKYSENKVFCVLNGINSDIFYYKNSIESRKTESICMLYHDLESKGSKEGLQAIYILKKSFPNLEVHLFGIVDAPNNLPKWITYKKNASENELQEIYNKSTIYLLPSWNEGFGLTGAESMMCGCVLVSTATDGVKEYSNSSNAVYFETHNVNEIYMKISELFKDKERIFLLSKNGHDSVSNLLDYCKSLHKFTQVIHGCEFNDN